MNTVVICSYMKMFTINIQECDKDNDDYFELINVLL